MKAEACAKQKGGNEDFYVQTYKNHAHASPHFVQNVLGGAEKLGLPSKRRGEGENEACDPVQPGCPFTVRYISSVVGILLIIMRLI